MTGKTERLGVLGVYAGQDVDQWVDGDTVYLGVDCNGREDLIATLERLFADNAHGPVDPEIESSEFENQVAIKSSQESTTYTSPTSMSLRDRLRDLPSIVGRAPRLLTTHEDPRTLMVEFLTNAIEANIPEPHAITLITVDDSGCPDARVLIIKDIDKDGRIAIATSSRSTKGRQLSANPHVALSWYCTPHARAIRVKGTASLADDDIASADFRARSNRAKAIAMAGTQSSLIPLDTDRAALINHMESSLSVSADTGKTANSSDWQVWLITPSEVEFWQGAKDRNHDRLKYTRTEEGWKRTGLWP